MPTLSDRDLAALALSAGWQGQDAVTATAVALAESRGVTTAHNGVPPDDSFGLWQINLIGSLRAPRLKAWGLSSPQDLYDPATNARAAYSLYLGRGRGFGDWTTYTGWRKNLPPLVPPPYKQFVPRAAAAVALAQAAPANPPEGVPVNPPQGAPVRPVPPAMIDRTTPPPAMSPDPVQPSSATLPGQSSAGGLLSFLSWIWSLIRHGRG